MAHVRTGRLLRLLGSFHFLEEVAEDTYNPTPFSVALGDRSSHVPDALDAGYVLCLLYLQSRASCRAHLQFIARTYSFAPCKASLEVC